jgi:hypothetical protein
LSPLENRKAGSRPSGGGERAQLHQLYAAKIAAARLYARPDELAAIIAALRAEEQAALDALNVRRIVEVKHRQGWRRPRRPCDQRNFLPKRPLGAFDFS